MFVLAAVGCVGLVFVDMGVVDTSGLFAGVVYLMYVLGAVVKLVVAGKGKILFFPTARWGLNGFTKSSIPWFQRFFCISFSWCSTITKNCEMARLHRRRLSNLLRQGPFKRRRDHLKHHRGQLRNHRDHPHRLRLNNKKVGIWWIKSVWSRRVSTCFFIFEVNGLWTPSSFFCSFR